MLSSENFRCKSDNVALLWPESDAAVSSINVKQVVWNKNIEMWTAFRLQAFPDALGRLGLHPLQSMTYFIRNENSRNTDSFLRPQHLLMSTVGRPHL